MPNNRKIRKLRGKKWKGMVKQKSKKTCYGPIFDRMILDCTR